MVQHHPSPTFLLPGPSRLAICFDPVSLPIILNPLLVYFSTQRLVCNGASVCVFAMKDSRSTNVGLGNTDTAIEDDKKFMTPAIGH